MQMCRILATEAPPRQTGQSRDQPCGAEAMLRGTHVRGARPRAVT